MSSDGFEDEKPLLEVPTYTAACSSTDVPTSFYKDDLPPVGAPASFAIPEDGVFRFREQQLWFRTVGRWAALLVCLPGAVGCVYYGVYLLQTRDDRDPVRRQAYMYFALAALLLLGVAYFMLSLAGTDLFLDMNRCCALEVRRGLGHVCRCCLSTTEVPFDRLRYIGLRPYKNESHKWTSIAVGYGKNPVEGCDTASLAGSVGVAAAGAVIPNSDQGSFGSLNGSTEYPREKPRILILCSWPDATHISEDVESAAAQTWQDRNTFVRFLAEMINERGGCIRVKEST